MVSIVSSDDDKDRSDEYWMGVRDALRMVDSFTKWAKRNPGRAKDLEDFIHDGLIAAAKRCESCLRDQLGLKFTDEADEPEDVGHDSDTVDEPVPSSYEMSVEPKESEPEESEQDLSDETPVSLDSVERLEDEEMGDLSIEGPPREFSTDFELVEPTPLIVDEDVTEDESISEEPEPTPEESLSESIDDEETDELTEPEAEEEEATSFSWSEYEKAVTPSSEPEPPDTEEEIVADEDEISFGDEDEELIEEPPEVPKIPSTSDETSIFDQDTEKESAEEDEEAESENQEDDEPEITTPPPPPPPPESEEDEEERRRRARRLFFGA